MRGLHPVYTLREAYGRVYTPVHTLREAYGRGIPYYTHPGRNMGEVYPTVHTLGGI